MAKKVINILGIETSCDETAAAIVQNGTDVLSNVIASQIKVHQKTGGVVPEVAAREHVKYLVPVIKQALHDARIDWHHVDAIAVTKGPGLPSSLVSGVTAANVLALLKRKPLIPVNHVEGHFLANFLDCEEKIRFPVLVLSVSGGHNELVFMSDQLRYRVLGETRDDAAGEAFDKVARLLGLPYPGGPAISELAKGGDCLKYHFPRAYLEKGSLDFSFSGLKTSILYFLQKGLDYGKKKPSKKFLADTAASFQEAIVDILKEKILMALKKFPEIREVHLTGGVSANKRLREVMGIAVMRIILRHPKKLSYCTDNAAMIACRGYFQFMRDKALSLQRFSPVVSNPNF